MVGVIKIAHLTSAHPRHDARIFYKMCQSLHDDGYLVSLIVADGVGDKLESGINIIDVGSPKNRVNRMLGTTRLIFKQAKLLDVDIYHLHDPELIPVGIKLKNLGKKVIFDAHEDLPLQILSKPYLGKISKWLLSNLLRLYQNWSCKRLDAVITATPVIKIKFSGLGVNVENINNFPIISNITSIIPKCNNKQVCYIGSLTTNRGIKKIVQAMAYTEDDSILKIAGSFNEEGLNKVLGSLPDLSKVELLGWLNRNEVDDLLCQSNVGLVTLYPSPNYIDSLPVKMFEYMSLGLPVIASNFPLWKEIVEGNDCGICVDPLDVNKIGLAIQYLFDNPMVAKKMGENGRNIVVEKYNWNIEEKKLINLYKELGHEP